MISFFVLVSCLLCTRATDVPSPASEVGSSDSLPTLQQSHQIERQMFIEQCLVPFYRYWAQSLQGFLPVPRILGSYSFGPETFQTYHLQPYEREPFTGYKGWIHD
eukprot:EG_transcript_49347